ncbi:MAG: AtpZ/AtpI family protein [Chloroflexi bacterium]|nr:AtpZ/AtpI family protein [Chloroflexota bacterium]MCH8108950.1 AtpZ/AtpI family protein [Chloroflexota bacterium]
MDARVMGTVLRLVGIGWYVAICIGGGAIGGLWLDRKLDLSPLFTLIGLSVGIAVAVVGMYRLLMAVLTSASENKESN